MIYINLEKYSFLKSIEEANNGRSTGLQIACDNYRGIAAIVLISSSCSSIRISAPVQRNLWGEVDTSKMRRKIG
jgi:hypothetical protein